MEKSLENSNSGDSGEVFSETDVKNLPVGPSTEKKGCTLARVYHGFWIFVFLVGIVMAIVSLALFGVKQAQVKRIVNEQHTKNTCILYGSRKDGNLIILSNTAICSYVLFSQSGILLLFIICVIYNIVLIVLSPKMLSPLRILELVLSVLGVLVSFPASVVIHAGLSTTCKAFSTIETICTLARLYPIENPDDKIGFYNEINAAKNVLWIITVGCILLSVMNIVLVIVYCIKASSKKKQQRKAETYNKLDEEVLQ